MGSPTTGQTNMPSTPPTTTTTSAPPTKGTAHTAIELAQALGVAFKDLYSGKGLEKLLPETPENAAENAARTARNEAIQEVQTDTITPMASEYVENLKQAFLVIHSPQLHSVDEHLAATALVKIAIIQSDTSSGGYNPFMGGLVGVALSEAMFEYMKTQMVGEKVAQNMWSMNMELTIAVTNLLADNIRAEAKAEAIEHIIQAACSAGMMVCSFAGGIGSMAAKTMVGGMGAQMGAQGGTQLFTTMQNAALAPMDILKGDLNAQKALLEMQKDFLSQIMSKCEDMRKDNAQNFDAFNQALKEWLTSLSKLVEHMSGH